MSPDRQIFLPGLEDLPVTSFLKGRRFPQPRLKYGRAITTDEIFRHELDLNFRGRMSRYISDLTNEHGFSFPEILTPSYLKVVELYLFPQPPRSRWLTQEEVMAQVSGDPDDDLRIPLYWALIRIVRRATNGPKAIEVLKFSPHESYLYRSLVENGVGTTDQIAQLSEEQLTKICGARPMFETLKGKMAEVYPGWNPQLVFRGEVS
jgi:hypothetical protein